MPFIDAKPKAIFIGRDCSDKNADCLFDIADERGKVRTHRHIHDHAVDSAFCHELGEVGSRNAHCLHSCDEIGLADRNPACKCVLIILSHDVCSFRDNGCPSGGNNRNLCVCTELL